MNRSVADTPPLSRQARLQADTYFRVMHLLEQQPDLTQRELAQHLDVSVGALNYCLKALKEKGWVKMQNFAHSKNKFGYIYVLTPAGLVHKSSLAKAFLKRKIAEYEALRVEIEALKSDIEWCDNH
ncbi:MarR family EPS-associated transcriptional regulator [Ectothiorhodospiraceae bacterium BW-2]|nr:MarR family EPS-associated transcriptional regulator [Ectothiorhodospiraceae bacterium BW-2]